MGVEGIESVLAGARKGLRRVTAVEAERAVRRGARLVDTRPEHQRVADGEIPGAIVVERNQLEWRLDPRCPHRVPEAASHDIHWIVVCDEGYSSSLAAASLQLLGLDRATDLIGGFRSWRASGLPIVRPARPTPPRGPGNHGLA
jgi:rhodanese-related sulfurtransferase